MRIYWKVIVNCAELKSNPSKVKSEKDFVPIGADGIGGIVIIETSTKKLLRTINANVVPENSHPMVITEESIVATNVTSKTS
jgi:hypothetical protein